jgi:cation:H+ antiporter
VFRQLSPWLIPHPVILLQKGPVLDEVGPFAAFAALLGVVVSALSLAGLIERRDRTVLRMGVDSFAVPLVYAGVVVVLARLS